MQGGTAAAHEARMQFVVRRDVQGRWRWTLEDRFLEVLAEGGRAYDSRAECLVAIGRVKTAYSAPVREETDDGPSAS